MTSGDLRTTGRPVGQPLRGLVLIAAVLVMSAAGCAPRDGTDADAGPTPSGVGSTATASATPLQPAEGAEGGSSWRLLAIGLVIGVAVGGVGGAVAGRMVDRDRVTSRSVPPPHPRPRPATADPLRSDPPPEAISSTAVSLPAPALTRDLILAYDLAGDDAARGVLEQALQHLGVRAPDVVPGQPFNATVHRAQGAAPDAPASGDLVIDSIVRPGWHGPDGLVRPTEVIVTRMPHPST